MILQTQANIFPVIPVLQWHILPLPSCCPVSGNPQPGSVIVILYHANDKFLEVYSLRKLVDSYIGGKPGVRDMEGMIQSVAQSCRDILAVPVTVGAFIILQRGDLMVTTCQV